MLAPDGTFAAPPHPFDPAEEPFSAAGRVTHIVATAAIALVVLPLRLLLLLVCALLSLIACSLCMGRTGTRAAPAPLVAVHRVVGRLGLLAFGVWPGLLTVNGRQESTPMLIAAPHCSALDGFFFLMAGMARPVALAPYARLPLVGILFRAARGIAVPLSAAPPIPAASRRSAKVAASPLLTEEKSGHSAPETNGSADGGAATQTPSATHAVRAAIQEHKRQYDAAAGDTPIVVFPEGTTHNGRALLTFFSGGFAGGSAVQPVLLQYPYRHLNSASYLTTLPAHIGRLLLAPWVVMRVTYLPAYSPSPEEREDPELMAKNVRALMATALGVPLSTIGAKALRQEAAAGRCSDGGEQKRPLPPSVFLTRREGAAAGGGGEAA